MALDPYASCPCGSGKKFKWCCQPIHQQIDKAFQQDAEGQHEAALRLMDEVVKEHAGNPEAWGRLAQLLYHNGKIEEAENALQKAFEINPNYAFGFLLRGTFRHQEGEVPGALMLYRKAAEAYDPGAGDLLTQVYSMIADAELKLNRPIAARAALQIAVHYQPADQELRKNLEEIFGDTSRLPASARREHPFQSPAANVASTRRAAWDRALNGAGTSKLSDAARAFEQLTQEDANDAAAWYNLGVARAWLGENRTALEALDRYVSLESDAGKAGAAWTLGEVLRCGHGVEDQADYLEHSVVYQIRDPQAIFGVLEEWERNRRLLGVQASQEEGVLSAVVLESTTGGLIAPTAGPQTAKLGAYLLLASGILRLWNPSKEALDRIIAELQQRSGLGLLEGRRADRPVMFHDVVAPALTFPVGPMDKAEIEKRIEQGTERYFEETWIHKPLKALSQVPPIDAAGSGTLRKKLTGVVQFLQECAAGGALQKYDFDRLRRKLGLLEGQPAEPAKAADSGPDISVLGAAELAGLQASTLSNFQLQDAFQAANKLAANELAGHFARELIGRPPEPEQPDRFPAYAYLIQSSVGDGNTDEALKSVDEGERYDREHNEGKRHNDYELRRGQIHVKRKEATQAQEVFQRLIDGTATELRYRGTAAEAMLALKQPTQALHFAEGGLAEARKQNDRDSEQYFLELVGAAKKHGG